MNRLAANEAAQLVVRAVNALLIAGDEDYRVAGEMLLTRRDGYLLIALPETQDAVDWRRCAPPINRQEVRP